MPEGVGYGLGSMQGPQMEGPQLDAHFRQAAQEDPGQAGQMFRAMLAQKGIDVRQPLVSTLTQYVATGGMDASEALRRLGGR